ncbi:MFS transporter [Endozoicomonas sp. SM1973]|uniref:MFS transporter n=1 Tax=Spartinivicinus marinus TaxID=2994442 RepID=A0A853I351_9GAMM|nr:MFS transporter [Spartinivicinus marinus]MCX4028181.1 MFS transporter [Spartinivicinus marinus]NYZ68380.1 MFS transporter [Spartinivicinus marinus]
MQRKYLSFIGLCLGFFIVMMDTTTVPLIYTTLMNEFNVSPAEVAWVNNIYLITYSAFLLLGGRLGDSANRKAVVLVALFVLGIGAAISGAGQTFTEVVIGRALMGVGAGLLTPQSMAYISILFADGGRGAALGVWGAVAGIATATGPVATQFFLTTADWRWVMWINIPVALVCLLVAILSLPGDPGRGIKFKETLVSSLYGACLAGIIVGIQFLSATESTANSGAILLLTSAIVAAILIRNELKKKREYILSRELWFDTTFLRICFISGLLGFSLTAFYLPLAFLLDIRMAFGPVATSVVMITIALSNALVGPFAGKFSDRMAPQIIVRTGLTLFALASASLGLIGLFIPGGALAFIALCTAMVIAGAGTGLAFAPLANLALGRAQIATIGRAAAFFNSIRQVMSALGGVIVAIAFDSIVRHQLNQRGEVTIISLRESPDVTAYAAFGCFLLIAVSLSVGAYLSSSRQEPALAKL